MVECQSQPLFFDSPFNKYTLLNFCKILSHIIYKVFLFKPNKCIEGIQFMNPGIQIVQNCHFKPFLSGEVWRLAFQQRLGPQWIWYETTRIMLLNNLSYTLNREKNLRRVRATLESSSNRESLTGSPVFRSLGILKIGIWRFYNWQIRIRNRTHSEVVLVIDIQEISLNFFQKHSQKVILKVIWRVICKVIWWKVIETLRFNISSAPFVSDLRLWELNLEIWAEKSRSRAWQNLFNLLALEQFV